MNDIICMGSATLDVFVKSRQEERKHSEHVDLCYHKGEKVLIDKLYFSTGGGGTNSAVGFSRLGLKAGAIGAVGTDPHGKIILDGMKKEKVSFLGKVKEGISGYSIILLGEGDRTILSYKGVNNSILWKDIDLSKIDSLWIYFSTLIGEGFKTLQKLAEFSRKKRIKNAANISQYEASFGLKKLSGFIKNLDILILNREEAIALCREKDTDRCAEMIMKELRGHLVITDGKNLVRAYYGGFKGIYKPLNIRRVVDSTGAGDAFATGFIYGIMNNQNIDKSVLSGLKEAKSVIGKIGAKEGLLRRL